MRLPAYSSLELNPVERWFSGVQARSLQQDFRDCRALLQVTLTEALEPSTGRSLLDYEALLVSPGGWKPSSHWDINALDRYKNALKVRFSAMLGEDPEIKLALV